MVHNTPGVTRDWKDGTCEMFGHAFTLTDTAGLQVLPAQPEPRSHRWQAPERGDDATVQMLGDLTTSVVATADLVVLVVDGCVLCALPRLATECQAYPSQLCVQSGGCDD